jgi:hypothetical protein
VESDGAKPRSRKGALKFVLLAAGLLVAAYFGAKSPRDQHVTLVLGPAADRVTGLEIQYIAADGDLARAARMTFEPGAAPRVVSHEPKLADGDYGLRIDLDTREGRRSTERRVTLGGGTTQVDLAGVITAPAPASPSATKTPP